MKMHVNISKALVGFIAGALFMAAVGTTIAATPVSSVIPNFTAMKIGSTASTPATGDLLVTGTGTFATKVSTPILTATSYVKTPSLVPTSSAISVAGSLNVANNITVSGSLSADSIGNFYTIQDYCDDDCNYTSLTVTTSRNGGGTHTYNNRQMSVSCSEDDTLVYCQSTSSDNLAWGNGDECTVTEGVSDGTAPVYASATCFSPDGGGISTMLTSTQMYSIFSEQIAQREDLTAAGIDDYFAIDLGTDIDVILQNMAQAQTDINEVQAIIGGLTDADGDLNLLGALENEIGGSIATESWVSDQSFATRTWVAGQSYATQSWVNSGFTTRLH